MSNSSQIYTNGTYEFLNGYNSLKIVNRILENQISEIKKRYELEKFDLIKEINSFTDENERYQEILIKNLAPDILAEAAIKNEINMLIEKNLVRKYSFTSHLIKCNFIRNRLGQKSIPDNNNNNNSNTRQRRV